MKKNLLFLPLCFFATSVLAQVTEKTIGRTVRSVMDKYNLSRPDVDGYTVTDNYTRQNGLSHVYLIQTANGHEIFNAMMQLHFSADGNLAYSNSRFVANKLEKTNATDPQITEEAALKSAVAEVGLTPGSFSVRSEKTTRPDETVLHNETLFRTPVRSTLGYEYVGDHLMLAYRLIVAPKGGHDMFNVRVDALTGKIIQSHNRTLHCQPTDLAPVHREVRGAASVAAGQSQLCAGAVYNAFPLNVESPIHGNRELITGAESPVASPFGWHDDNGIPGAEYTITRGNNVYAYSDEQANNVPGYSPDGGSSLLFDFPLDTAAYPQQNRDASLTNLFVWNNFMHDVAYHYGFDEVSGNFQTNNYGNGGSAGDAVYAEGFNSDGFLNATFLTLEDGQSPRMQTYLWFSTSGNLLTINSPSAISGIYTAGTATFGPPPPNPGPITADLALMLGSWGNPTEGCIPIDPSYLNGKIAVVDRGGICPNTEKVWAAQQAGAVAVIIINNVPGPPMLMPHMGPIWLSIPCISLSLDDGTAIKDRLQNGITVNGSIGGQVDTSTIYDCNFDNGIVSHEYTHGISTRLTGGPSNVDCLGNNEQAGEGWSDFFALVITEPAGSSANDARGMGSYLLGQSPNGPGVRPYPYSYDMNINPLTYDDIHSLAVPHGVGSVWCSVIWDLYWDMVAEYGHSRDLYAQNGGNNKAIQLVMEGLRLQPCSPGFVDARDAILQADQLLFGGVNRCLIWKTFARRGLGYSASQGSSSLATDGTEAFNLPPGCSGGDINFNVSSRALCEQQSVTFQNLVTPQATSFAWTFPGGTPATSSDPNPTVTYDTPGMYPVTLSADNANGNQTYTEQAFIQVAPLITFTLSIYPVPGNPLSNTVTANITAGTGPFQYAWDDSSASADHESPVLVPGTHTVTVSNGTGCSSSQEFIIPYIGFSTSSQRICEQQSVIFYHSVIPEATSFLWTFPGGNPATSTDADPSVTYNSIGTYTVTLSATGADGTQTHTESGYIQVSPKIVFTVHPAPAGTDNSGSATVIVTAGNGPYHYVWEANPAVDNAIITGLPPGTHSVTVSNEWGCSSTQTFVIPLNVNGVDEYESHILSIFPNPSENILTIRADEPIYTVRITDIAGKSIRVLSVNAPVYSMDISDLAAGTYLFHIQTDSQIRVRKVVKK